MNAVTLIIRFGIGTLIAAGATAVSASEPVIDLAVAEIIDTSSSSVSADISSRHQPSMPENAQTSLGEAQRARSELQLADDMARQLDAQLERRLASQLERLI